MLSNPRWFQSLGTFVSLLALGGCYGLNPQGYRPYGTIPPYGQPQYLPNTTPYPGAVPVPGGVVIPPSGAAPYEPGSTTSPADGWSPIDDGSSGLGDDGFGSGDSGSGYGGSGGSGDSGTVPDPNMFEPDQDSFGALENPGVDVQASAFRQSETGRGRQYGYDTANYAWVRGIIGYEEGERLHNIMYSLRPDDEYGGNFSLVPDAKLKSFRPGDIVQITGRIDRTQRDMYGKPMYRADSIERLIEQ